MRIALIVPVLYRGPQKSRKALQHFHRVNIAQAEALAELGEEVYLIVDGPAAYRGQLKYGAKLIVVASPRTEKIPAAHLLAQAWRLKTELIHFFHLLDVRSLAFACTGPARVFAEYNSGYPPQAFARKRVMHWASRRLSGVFFTHHRMADEFVNAGALSTKTPVYSVPEISSALSLERSSENRNRSDTVLVVMRAAEGKDPWTALSAFELFKKEHISAKLHWLVIEQGPLHQELQRRVDSSELLRESVRIEVGLGPEQMARAYAEARVFLHTSRREACSYALMEAMQAGLNIVCSQILPFEAVTGGETAILCPVGDEEAFARGLRRGWEESDLGNKAQTRFIDRLSFTAIARRKLAAYQGQRLEPYYPT